ncbi:MAG TPA: hypothetical protein VD770_00375, partial [Coxiellaceae bacterium]|nr:hypothetical protein [Coxiellaceae bacterium]
MSLADVTKALETLQLDLLKSTWNAPLQARWSEVSSSTRPSENLQLLALPEADPHLLPISVSTATGSKPTAITIEQTHKTSLNTLATDPKTNYKIRL